MPATQQPAAAFSPESAQLLQSIMTVCHFGAQSYLFMEGDPAQYLYFIEHGSVKVTKSTLDGKEMILYFLRDGDYFGEIGGTDGDKHQLNAQVMKFSRIGMVRMADLYELMAQHPELAREMIQWIGLMAQKTQSKIRDLLLYGKPGALCSTLIRLCNTFGQETEKGIRINLKLTHTELAQMIGTTREGVNRMLKELKEKEVICCENGHITVKDLHYLRSVCNCSECPKEICRI